MGDLLGNLVTAASVENGLTFPEVTRGQLLTLLGRLCTEYDWPLDEDQRVFLGREDWVSEAINNTRSRALRDLLRYGRWRGSEDPDADVSGITETLESRFPPDSEFPLSLPERAILGLGYLDALAMNEAWALEHKTDFFPQDDIEHWIVSFGDFLEHHRPHPRIFEIFADDFNFAVKTLPQQAEHNPALSQLLDILGQRLVTYGASGMFPLRGEGSPLEGYYQATDGRRQYWADLFEHVGRRLYHVEGELDEVVRQRYEAFFEWRLEVGDPTELARFDSWLEASCLSIEWRLDAYSRALDVCQFDRGSFWHHWAPISEIIPEHTGRVVECFAKLVARFPRDSYLNRFREGQSMTKVVDTPYFVDSRYTMGIQLADIVAGVVRQYHENDLSRGLPSDPYLRAVGRYYRTIESKMQDLTSPDGFQLPSLYFMAERLHYFGFEEEASEAG